MTSREDFSQAAYEPVAERILGYRAFAIDMNQVPPVEGFEGGVNHAHRRGQLRGVFQTSYVWGPGVNTATCLSTHLSSPTTRIPKHEHPVEKCMCGFWAYTTGEHVLSVAAPTAFGVIEAWGRMVVGPLGFRAEKARIVALCFPSPREAVRQPGEPGVPVRLSVLSPTDMIRYTMRQVGSLISDLARRMNAALAAVNPNHTTLAPKATVTAIPPLLPSDLVHTYQAHVTPDLIATVRRLYPDAVIFRSVAAMQAEFPLTDLTALLPEPEGEAAS